MSYISFREKSMIATRKLHEKRIIPNQWQQVIIIAVDKKGNREELSKSQKGLFSVNIVSKVHEKIKKLKMKLYKTKCQKCKQQVKNKDRKWTTL